jgi:DNA-binding MarR family transcriptional regulator
MPRTARTPGERGRPATDRLHYVVARLSRALSRATDNVALRHGLTPPEFMAALVLAEGNPLSNAQLARRTFVTSQATHEVLAAMFERGLVQREDHTTNRRIRLISLTDEGWLVIEKCTEEVVEIEQRIISGLEPLEQEIFLPALLHGAEVLAGGYFGDEKAESAALALRATSR